MNEHDQRADPRLLLAEFDLFDARQMSADAQLLADARRHCPVARTSTEGQWLVTRFEDVKRVLLDPETFSSAGVAPRPSPVRLPPLDSDPPFHSQLRQLLNPYFSRGQMLKYEPRMRELAAELASGLSEGGSDDLLAAYVTPFVAGVLAEIVFDQPDRTHTEAAVAAVMRNADENTPESFLEIARLAGEFLAEQRSSSDRDTVLSALANSTLADGRRLSSDEQVAVVSTLFMAGLDTTRGAIGLIVEQMTLDPSLEHRLRRPGWERSDLDELVRLTSPVACLGRRATRDTEVAGVPIAAGEQVLVHFASANRDETQFERPDELAFGTPRSHAGFGLGIHRCLGAQMARVQIQVGIEELLRRVTGIRPAPGPALSRTPGITNGVETLPVEFDLRNEN